MHKFIALISFIIMLNGANGQNSFSFNCTKDTSIICTTSCITLRTTLPDIHSSTSTYITDQLSSHTCFRGYTDPSIPNASANLLIDDKYSPVIDITFPFSFFGTTYNQLIASTNGFLSFDISKALTFSHYGILANGSLLSATQGTPQDLPSTLYDKALIMGPYHDLDPNNSLSSQQIKYEVIGTAPYRKWILTYYNEPLYTTACLNLNKNTHQIVLYETLGIVEVFIYDKDICLNWNDGRAMIGMQDFSRTSAIMAPGRKASDAPWGTKGMDESWRFIPASGPSLFKKVELDDISGNFITQGDTANIGNNQIGVSFKNICPPSSGASYIVKSFYKDPSNSANEIIGIDTINVSRGDPIAANVSEANCSPGSTGTITVTSPTGPAYEYSIDGVNWQSSNLFTEPVGTYIIQTRVAGSKCISTKTVGIDYVSFDATASINVTPCPGPLSGKITVYPEHGTAPYSYSLNGGPFQTSNVFTNVPKGIYTVIIKDANGCSYSLFVIVAATDLATADVTNTICGAPASGIIKVHTPRYGFPPYTYSINGGPYQTSNIFNNLDAGTYVISILDSAACAYSFNVTVNPDVLLITNPIITMPSCANKSDGSLFVSPTPAMKYQFSLDSNPYKNDGLFTNLSAGNYTLHVKDSLGCIKDTVITIQQPNPVNETFILTPATNCLTITGNITIKANGGTTPYQYSIDSGSVYQVSNIFTVSAGVYNVTVKDSKGCKTNNLATVPAINNLIKVDIGPDKTICAGSAVVINSTTSPVAKFYNWTPGSSLKDSTTSSVIATPADTTFYILNAKTDVCQGADTIKINVLHKPIPNAGNDTVLCFNSTGILNGSITNTSGSVNYLWSPAQDLLTPNKLSTVVKPITTRTHTYRLTVTDNYGCNFNVYDDVKVTMNEAVHAFAGDDTVAVIGVPHQLFGSGGYKYFWSPTEVLDNPSLQNPTAILNFDTRFNLTVKDTLGCVGTSSVLVKVYNASGFYIPNAFTPNGDGNNDLFYAIAPGITHTIYFRIYNRLGQMMYQSNDIRKGWDGRYLGAPQPGAVYVWTIKGIDISGKTVERKGIVTLIR